MPSCGFSKGLRRLAPGRRGATSLEFALTGALVMALTLGAADFCRYMITLSSLRMASAEAVRMVTLAGGGNINAGLSPCTGLSGALAGAAARVRFLDAAQVAASLSGCQTDAFGVTSVTVTLNYPFRFIVDAFGARDRALGESAQASFN